MIEKAKAYKNALKMIKAVMDKKGISFPYDVVFVSKKMSRFPFMIQQGCVIFFINETFIPLLCHQDHAFTTYLNNIKGLFDSTKTQEPKRPRLKIVDGGRN